ncbi:protein ImuA [Pedobacter sp. UYP30]|uniref:ImuA family protein n=1 Tax=Pedobacter sp. UYP30 TaxID=1756400 RepID=UPI003395B546
MESLQKKNKQEIISQLRKEILHLEGFKPVESRLAAGFGLGDLEHSFPNKIFPIGAIHEFLCAEKEQAAASGGFISGLLAKLMKNNGTCIWISSSRLLFPPALKIFGVAPDKIIFIDLKTEKDILWATEEALKCNGLQAVVTELKELNFAQSRRLQLAVEKSKVTGFVLRSDESKICPTACLARWRISSLPSITENGMPGVGYPNWQVELLKVKNGQTGIWQIEWSATGFKPLRKQIPSVLLHQNNHLKTGS